MLVVFIITPASNGANLHNCDLYCAVLNFTWSDLVWGGGHCDIVLTHLEAPDKTSAFVEVLQPAEHQLIRCI